MNPTPRSNAPDGTTNRWTPGPWNTAGLTIYAQPEKRSFGGPIREYLRPICCMESAELECDEYTTQASGADYNERLPGRHEASANARLIALAPEMAEAITDAEDCMGDAMSFIEAGQIEDALGKLANAQNRARAILARLNGEGGAT